jgi:hypothetical protein
VRPLFVTLWTLSALLLLVWTLAPPPAPWIDAVYTPVLYAGVARALVPVTGALPVSLAGLVGLGGALWVGVSLVRSWRRLGFQAFLARWGLRAAFLGTVLPALFILLWGANYARTPLETRYGLPTHPTQAAEVEQLARSLAQVVTRDAPTGPLPEDAWEQGVAAARVALTETVAALEGRSLTLPRHVKRTPPGLLIFLGQATGIVVPWTLEAHVDGALPLPYALGTALHELTHLAGYGSEAETDFLTGLAGLTSADPLLRYSTALTLFSRVARSLEREVYRELYTALPEVAREDIAALRAVYHRFFPPRPAAWVQTLFYDTYLRSQGVGAGVADYDRATDLLVGAQRSGLLRFDGASGRFEIDLEALPSAAPRTVPRARPHPYKLRART